MPIVKSKAKPEKEQIRISLDMGILESVRTYCEVFTIKKIDEFFEQAAEYILSKDKDWQKHITNMKENVS